MDGRKLLEYVRAQEPGTPDAQTFGFESSYLSPWRIQRVRILSRALPEYISPLAIARHSEGMQLFDRASREYQAIADAYPNRPIGITAAFGHAICLVESGDARTGVAELAGLAVRYPDHALVPDSLYQRLRVARAQHDDANVEALIDQLGAYPHSPMAQAAYNDELLQLSKELAAAQHHVIGEPASGLDVVALAERGDRRLGDLGRRLGVVSQHYCFTSAAGDLLAAAGEDEALVRLFPGTSTAAEALGRLGRYDEAIACAGPDLARRANLLVESGRAAELLNGPFPQTKQDYARQVLGMPPVAGENPLPDIPMDPDDADALLARKDIDGLRAHYPNGWQVLQVLLDAGREDEAIVAGAHDFAFLYGIFFKKLAEHDTTGAMRLFSRLQAGDPPHDHVDLMLPHLLLPVLLTAWNQGTAPAQAQVRALRKRWPTLYSQRLAFVCDFLLGACDDRTFLQQPYQMHVDLLLTTAKAVKADMEHRIDEAEAFYARLSNLPQYDALNFASQFAAWRTTELEARRAGQH